MVPLVNEGVGSMSSTGRPNGEKDDANGLPMVRRDKRHYAEGSGGRFPFHHQVITEPSDRRKERMSKRASVPADPNPWNDGLVPAFTTDDPLEPEVDKPTLEPVLVPVVSSRRASFGACDQTRLNLLSRSYRLNSSEVGRPCGQWCEF